MSYKTEKLRSANEVIEGLEEEKYELADRVQEFSESQVATWGMIPYLSSRAYGREDQADEWIAAFAFGIWPIISPIDRIKQPGLYHTGIDLATGKLINPSAVERELGTLDILNLDFEDLNASLVLKGLESALKIKRDKKEFGNPIELAKIRRRIRKLYNIPPVREKYKRDVGINPLISIKQTSFADIVDDLSGEDQAGEQEEPALEQEQAAVQEIA